MFGFTATRTLKEELAKNAKASVAATGILNGAKVGLGKIDKAIPATITLAELEADECDYGGYAQVTATWSVPTLSTEDDIQLLGTIPEFRPTDSVTPNVVHYAWITDSAGTKVLAVGKFDDPGKAMASALNAINMVAQLRPTADIPVEIID